VLDLLFGLAVKQVSSECKIRGDILTTLSVTTYLCDRNRFGQWEWEWDSRRRWEWEKL